MSAALFTSAAISEPSFYINTHNPEDPFAVVHLDGAHAARITTETPGELRQLATVLLDAADELERRLVALGSQP